MSTALARKTPAPSGAPKKNVVSAKAAAAYLRKLKTAAPEGSRWWTRAVEIEWSTTRKGNNGTAWSTIYFTTEEGVRAPLTLRITAERHTGQLMPKSDAGLAELMQTQKPRPNARPLEKRTRNPALQFLKWNAQVKCKEDGITPYTDEEGNPILPGDDKRSPYYDLADLINEIFMFEVKERIDLGNALVAHVNASKRADKAATAAAIIEAFNKQNERKPSDIILSSESVATIRKFFNLPKDTDTITKGAIIAPSTKVASLIQEFISDQAKQNAGMPLPNPMTRISMKFDQTTGVADPNLKFFDKSREYMAEGRKMFEEATVDGVPINDDNIHKFIRGGSLIDGVVDMGVVCFSSMGISIPVKVNVAVVSAPEARSVGLDDVYGDEDDEFGAGYGAADAAVAETVAAPVAPAAAAAPAVAAAAPAAAPVAKPAAAKPAAAKPAAAAAKPAAPPAEENYDDLIDELGAE
jgi:hypothetical protein